MLGISKRKRTKWLKIGACGFFVFFFIYLFKVWTTRIGDDNQQTIRPCTDNNCIAKNVTLRFQDFKIDYQLLSDPNVHDSCNKKQVVVLIASAPNHFHTRLMIRESWINKSAVPSDFLALFIVGAQSDPEIENQLNIEANLYHDIVRYDSLDSYRRLFVKTHATFEWFRTNCEDSSFLIKVDDDAVLHLKRIEKFVEQEAKVIVEQRAESMFCNVQRNHHPFRNPWSKLYVPFSTYGSFTFPDYCQGGSYMLTKQAVIRILENTKSTNLIPLEDVLYTGVIGHQHGLHFYATPAFCYEEHESSCLPNGKIPRKAAACGVEREQIRNEFKRLDALTCHSTGILSSSTSLLVFFAFIFIYQTILF